MKIAVWHNLHSGGAKRALYAHVRGLVARGHHVEAWCPPTADRKYLPLTDFITEHVVDFDDTITFSGRGLAGNARHYQEITQRLKAMEQHDRRCAEQINAGDFDLFIAHPCIYFRVSSLGKYLQIPKVIYIQEPYRPLYEAAPVLPWLAIPPATKPWWRSPRYIKHYLTDLINVQGFRIQAREEYRNAASYDTRLVNSYFSRESVLRAYGLDADVCYLGVDTSKFIHKNLNRKSCAVGIGAFVPAKNIEFVLDAIGTIPREKRPPLLWVGNASDKGYLDKLKQKAMDIGVEFTPKESISDDEIITLFNEASVMAYAPRLEPFGYAPLEANACGLPVVGVAEGGVRETVQEGANGFIVDNDPASMGQAIQQLLDDPQKVKSMGDQSRAMVERQWSEAASIDRLEQHLFKVIAAAGHHEK